MNSGRPSRQRPWPVERAHNLGETLVGTRFQLRLPRPAWTQILVSLLIAALGLMGARALSEVDQDLRIMYTEYTLGATDLAHISADVMRYRTIIVRSLEAPTQKDFERITKSLPDQRARIQHAVDRYAAATLRVSRSGRSEPEDIQSVRESLDAYFAAASRTIALLSQEWTAGSPHEAAELPHRERRSGRVDVAGPSDQRSQQLGAADRLTDGSDRSCHQGGHTDAPGSPCSLLHHDDHEQGGRTRRWWRPPAG